MRTVTFSNASVAGLVNDNFVSTWFNRDATFHNSETSQEKWIRDNARECFATFFATPEGMVLHYFSGFFSPESFEKEVRFVLDLARETLDAGFRPKSDTVARYREAHKKRSDLRKTHLKKVQDVALFGGWDGEALTPATDPNPSSAKALELSLRKGNVMEGLRYLAQVHLQLESEAIRSQLMPLDNIFRTYLVGNTFTEGSDPKQKGLGKDPSKDKPGDPGVGDVDNDTATGGAGRPKPNKGMPCKKSDPQPVPAPPVTEDPPAPPPAPATGTGGSVK